MGSESIPGKISRKATSTLATVDRSYLHPKLEEKNTSSCRVTHLTLWVTVECSAATDHCGHMDYKFRKVFPRSIFTPYWMKKWHPIVVTHLTCSSSTGHMDYPAFGLTIYLERCFEEPFHPQLEEKMSSSSRVIL